MSICRRSFLSISASAFGALVAGVSLPLRVLAQHVRLDAGFAATDMAGAYAALGGTPEASSDIVFTSPEIAENGAVVPHSTGEERRFTKKL